MALLQRVQFFGGAPLAQRSTSSNVTTTVTLSLHLAQKYGAMHDRTCAAPNMLATTLAFCTRAYEMSSMMRRFFAVWRETSGTQRCTPIELTRETWRRLRIASP